jgi:Tfp pilus assembly protein PilO
MAINTSLNTPYLVLTGVVVIAIAFLFTVLQPLMDSITTAKSDIASHMDSFAEKDAFLKSLDVKMAQLRSQGDVEKQLAAVIPESERSQDVVRILDQYAKESGVTVTSVANNSSQAKAHANASKARGDINLVPEGLQTITFDIRLIGTYPQVRDFISGLQKSPRVIDATHITMSQIAGQPGAVTGSFTIQFYARSEAAVAL